MTLHDEHCVSFVNDNDRLTAFKIPFASIDSVDWDKLSQTPTLRQVHVSGVNRNRRLQHHLRQLSRAIQSHPGITDLFFYDCSVDDLTPLFKAVSNKHQPATIRFDTVSFWDRRALKSLRQMLESNSIKVLSMDYCTSVSHNVLIEYCTGVNDNVSADIAVGLRTTQSLQEFEFTWESPSPELFASVNEMLTTSSVVSDLKLTIDDSARYWDLFRAIEQQNTLQSLQICNTTIDMESMGALMAMCVALPSLKRLDLKACTLEANVLDLMNRELSKPNAIDTLNLSYLLTPTADLDIELGSLKVNNLALSEISFTDEAFSRMIECIANNPCIESLELRDRALRRPNNCQQLCDILLRENVGPTNLVLDLFPDSACKAMLTEALQVNTHLSSLTIGLGSPAAALVSFAQGLANMSGLRKLAFSRRCSYSDEFFHAIQESLECNTSLLTLSFDGIHSEDAMVNKYLPRIRYLLAINRVGRHRLMALPTPVGLWSHVLARSSNEPDGIHFVLTEQPGIIVHAPPVAAASRKRMSRDGKDSISDSI